MTSLATQLLTVPEQQEPVVTAQMAALVLTAALTGGFGGFSGNGGFRGFHTSDGHTFHFEGGEGDDIFGDIFPEICSAAVKMSRFTRRFSPGRQWL